MRSQTPTIALAGYTNVGKSTLLNALTGAEASIDDRLFETLDPTTRSFEYEGRRYLLTDTVGLHPAAAARARRGLRGDPGGDAHRRPHPPRRRRGRADDAELDQMVEAVEAVLTEIGAGELPIELVLNKIDRRRRRGTRAAREPLPGLDPGLGAKPAKAWTRSALE